MIGRIPTLLLALPALAGPGAAQDSTYPFEERARAVLEQAGHEPTPAPATWDALLESEAFLAADLGIFQLRYPVAALGEKKGGDRFRDTILLPLLDLQVVWLEWTAGERAGAEEVLADARALRKWASKLKGKKLAALESGAGLLAQLEAGEDLVAGVGRIRAFTARDAAAVESVGQRDLFVYAPTRGEFVDLVSVAGFCHTADRGHLWIDSAAGYTALWRGSTQIIALENAAFPLDFQNPEGYPMNEGDETGQVQYMVERGAASLLRSHFYRSSEAFFESGVLANLVLEVVGRNTLKEGNWSEAWSRSGNRTQAYERFIPGGNSEGGYLPKRPAGPGVINRPEVVDWMTTGGEDHFVGVLAVSQAAGAKKAKGEDDTAHFKLRAGTSDKRGAVVSAPFFGPGAQGKTLPPNEYIDDYERMYRCYRVAFVHWLRTEGAGKESAARFGALVLGQPGLTGGRTLAQLVEEVYGVPLGYEPGAEENLENRFLAWLADQKVPRAVRKDFER